ncbi:MAG: hypothetical protein IJ685_08050 [Selenomonadaceae bacterium]|nr:hypothetical protein [Selenomonadaceae bacterium]
MEDSTTKKFYPVRPIQRWLVDTHFNKAKSTMMNIGGLYKLSAQIDLQRFVDAINEVLFSHDIFRCRFLFHPETSDLCQIFDGDIEPVTIYRTTDEFFQSKMNQLREPYKIIGNPLGRIYVIETPTAKYFYADFYHAIMDGVAAAILFIRELDKVYRGRKSKRPALSYAEYVDEESKIPPEELAEGHAYWKKMLAPFDKKKHLPPVDVENVAAWTQGNVDYKLQNFTEEFFRNTRRNENTFFLGATMLTLAKVTGSKESIMSWIHNGRTTMHERRLMGLMLEQFPCAWDFHEDISVRDFLDKLEGQINTGFQYRKSLNVVYNDGLEDDCVSFIFQKDFHNDFVLGEGTMEVVYLPPNEVSAVENALDVEVEACEDGTYDVFLDYDAGRYSKASMKNFAATMNKILIAMTDETKHVSEILR